MIIKFKPIMLEKVWGGNSISRIYKCDKNQIGEIWGISAHQSNSNIIKNGEYKGLTFRELYKEHRELFGRLTYDEFPILFKLIDAADDLSIQVHPNNEYARKMENTYGKDECWYILDTKSKNSEIIIGHKAQSKRELIDRINSNNYNELLNRFPIKPKDYFYIPSGKIHAICRDTILLEVSQSSDVTYRLFDYNRLDKGQLRELHIDKAISTTKIPDSKLQTTHLNKYFNFEILENKNTLSESSHIYGDYYYVIDGNGFIDDEVIKKGDFLMITSNQKYRIRGSLKYIKVTIV